MRVKRFFTPGSPENMSKLLELDGSDCVRVDMRATVTPALLAEIAALGGMVESSFPSYGAIRPWMHLPNLALVAGRSAVRSE